MWPQELGGQRAENGAHLHRLQGIPWAQQASSVPEALFLHAYPWPSQKQAILE